MILHVVNAKYLKDYEVEVAFNDGRKGVADLSDSLWGSMFEPLRDKRLFAQLRVDEELQTIAWPKVQTLRPNMSTFGHFTRTEIFRTSSNSGDI